MVTGASDRWYFPVVCVLLMTPCAFRSCCLGRVVDHPGSRISAGTAARTNDLENGARERARRDLPMSKIGVRGRWLVDRFGRVRIFHGWNSVQKGAPWYTEEVSNRTKLGLYRELGFNVVRLGCMWSGFEPAAGWYNETHVDVMRRIVSRLERLGFYVILDMHQDLMSTMFGNYDGVPLWIVKRFPPPAHPYPWPLRRGHFMAWTDGYLSEAVGAAFQRLYDNYAGSLDSMAAFWAKVAAAFAGRPNVLGYELINEPWAGDIYARPDLLEPGNAGRTNLAPAYDRLNDAIRRLDDRTLLFYEPVTWGVFANGARSGTGFDRVPGGPAYADRSVLAYHYYCWLMDVARQHEPFSFLQRAVCDGVAGPAVFSAVLDDVRRTNGSSFLTEFGACEPDGNANSSATVECEFVMGEADRHLASWTYWDSAFFDDRGRVDWNVARSFARVYARAVSGVPEAMSFNRTDLRFYLRFEADGAIEQPTEIVIPRIHYPAGFRVDTSAGIRWLFDEDERLLKLYYEGNYSRRTIEVRIRPKVN